jgi:cytidine deaminase
MKELVDQAIVALGRGFAPYGRFLVGAALETSTGKIYAGCNIENGSYWISREHWDDQNPAAL